MNTSHKVYSFELSPAELHWLAGAFAIQRLPLPEDPSRFISVAGWNSQLAQAPAKLQERGLLSGSAQAGWQIDRLPGAVVNWLGSARGMLRVDVQDSAGGSRCTHSFLEYNAGLQVRLSGTTYEFMLFPDCNTMIEHCLDELGVLGIDPAQAKKKYVLAQPRIIVAAAWKDPSLAAKMLKVSRSRLEDIRALLAWAETLKWIAELSHVQLDGEEVMAQKQTVLCGNRQNAWVGEAGGSADDDMVAFSSIDLEGVRDVFRRLL